MKQNHNRPPEPKQDKGKEYLYFLRKEVAKESEIPIEEFLALPESTRFRLALKHVVTTKKAVCEAFHLKVEAMCREKRRLEDQGILAECFIGTCPYTGSDGVAFLTTNPQTIKMFSDE